MKIEDMLDDNQMNMIFMLGMIVNVVNLWDFYLDQQQTSNDEIMQVLQAQDQRYLRKILENQEYIMKEITYIKERLDNGKN